MSEHVRRTRRRTRLTAGQTLGIIFALMLITGLAGFAWGMWDEVALRPGTYKGLSTRSGMPVFVKWSVATAMRLVDLQGLRSRSERVPAVAGAPATAPDRRIQAASPGFPPTMDPTGGPVDRLPPEPPTEIGEGNPSHPPEEEPSPVPPTEVEPPLPVPPPVREPKPVHPPQVGPDRTLPEAPERPQTPGLDTVTAELLEKADARYQTAWEYYLKSRPEAPAAGRRAATIAAAKSLKETQQLYLAVLARELPHDLHKEIEERLVEVQRALYWSNKFKGM